jgi:hypothetical protein
MCRVPMLELQDCYHLLAFEAIHDELAFTIRMSAARVLLTVPHP